MQVNQVKYLLFEAVCFFDDSNAEFKCPTGGNISNSCIFTADKGISVCEHLCVKKAGATAAVTDTNGNVVNASEFFGDLELTDNEYAEKEKEWIIKCSGLIDDL